uniref:Uncharacterized protein n=1 Tax=Nicotiana tabacum TaxID=4097 RepID=A0A1S4BEC3_TOBAC|nr:PREDICTED: uncharacterized protein LOC107807429 [Nicotiana tabacum]
MPTPGLRVFTSPVHEVTQASSSVLPENKQTKKSVAPKICYQQFDVSQGILQQSVTSQGILQQFAPCSDIVDDESEYENGDEDNEEPILRPKVISEAKTRLQQKKLLQKPTGIRKINFKGDETGVNIPTNLPYSPKKVTWKGNAAMTSNQLVEKNENRVGKLKAKKAKC